MPDGPNQSPVPGGVSDGFKEVSVPKADTGVGLSAPANGRSLSVSADKGVLASPVSGKNNAEASASVNSASAHASAQTRGGAESGALQGRAEGSSSGGGGSEAKISARDSSFSRGADTGTNASSTASNQGQAAAVSTAQGASSGVAGFGSSYSGAGGASQEQKPPSPPSEPARQVAAEQKNASSETKQEAQLPPLPRAAQQEVQQPPSTVPPSPKTDPVAEQAARPEQRASVERPEQRPDPKGESRQEPKLEARPEQRVQEKVENLVRVLENQRLEPKVQEQRQAETNQPLSRVEQRPEIKPEPKASRSDDHLTQIHAIARAHIEEKRSADLRAGGEIAQAREPTKEQVKEPAKELVQGAQREQGQFLFRQEQRQAAERSSQESSTRRVANDTNNRDVGDRGVGTRVLANSAVSKDSPKTGSARPAAGVAVRDGEAKPKALPKIVSSGKVRAPESHKKDSPPVASSMPRKSAEGKSARDPTKEELGKAAGKRAVDSPLKGAKEGVTSEVRENRTSAEKEKASRAPASPERKSSASQKENQAKGLKEGRAKPENIQEKLEAIKRASLREIQAKTKAQGKAELANQTGAKTNDRSGAPLGRDPKAALRTDRLRPEKLTPEKPSITKLFEKLFGGEAITVERVAKEVVKFIKHLLRIPDNTEPLELEKLQQSQAKLADRSEREDPEKAPDARTEEEIQEEQHASLDHTERLMDEKLDASDVTQVYSIRGRVVDFDSGQAISGATLHLSGFGSVSTNAMGEYLFKNIPHGTPYTLIIGQTLHEFFPPQASGVLTGYTQHHFFGKLRVH